MVKQGMTQENVKPLFDSPFIRVADLQYAPGKHYYNASRRKIEDMVAVKSEEEFRTMLPDAVSCVVVLDMPGEEPRLLLSYEYRYPAGQFLLSVPAGLIDQEDQVGDDPVTATAVREIREETGLEVREGDSVRVVNPLLFSTPGMTDESNALVCVRTGICPASPRRARWGRSSLTDSACCPRRRPWRFWAADGTGRGIFIP